MSAESPRMVRSGGEGALTVPATPPPDRSLINTVSGFISDVKLTSTPPTDPKDVIQWARFETIDINEPLPEGDQDSELSPIILVLGYGQGVQVWSVTPNGDAKEVLSWRQGVVRVLRILSSPIGLDIFAHKRPLIALCDSSSPGTSFCSLSFISLRNGDQVKSIKFKNPILDVLSNKRSIVVSFAERFAVFDAGTFEDRMTVTTCYPCPCPLGGCNPINPLALGDRWLAYADKKLISSKRSSGGCESDGVPSYTASVLHAAKSLSKGLRGLSESVAYSLAGSKTAVSQSPSPPTGEHHQPGVVTILDIENPSEEDLHECDEPYDPIVAHFIAHSDAIIAMKFDASGMLLVTADKRGHDFHVFRINPHPFSSSLAAVHHLYVLHRGDTTAKVQDIAISLDSRWVSVSTLRGTTHLFPINPYGGTTNMRTHTHPRVVNRLSRFQRSAGLPLDRPHSPVCDGLGGGWFPNPRLPPYPAPTHTPALAHLRATPLPTHTITRNSSGRQRLSSTSEDCGVLLARAFWAPFAQISSSARTAVYSLYVLGAGGQLTHYRVQPKTVSGVSREKVCEDTSIELECEPTCAWSVCNRPTRDLPPPLCNDSPILARRGSYNFPYDASLTDEERWLSQVEIVTHAGPHRRLWMGPQFVFKTYNTNMGSAQSLIEEADLQPARTPPVSVPARAHPLLLHSGSTSSLEHSPSDGYRKKSIEAAGRGLFSDVQLKEDLAEAMKETEGRVRARRISDAIYANNDDEASFRCVRCAPAEPPAPLLPARSLSPASRHLPAAPAPLAPSPPPSGAELSGALRLPVALAAVENTTVTVPLASCHDPQSKYEIPQVLMPSTWPHLEIPLSENKTELRKTSQKRDASMNRLIADASVNVDTEIQDTTCKNFKDSFDVIDLDKESHYCIQNIPNDYSVHSMKENSQDEDFEVENILHVTLSLGSRSNNSICNETPDIKPFMVVENFDIAETVDSIQGKDQTTEAEDLPKSNISEQVLEIGKSKSKRSRKSKQKQGELKQKYNEQPKIPSVDASVKLDVDPSPQINSSFMMEQNQPTPLTTEDSLYQPEHNNVDVPSENTNWDEIPTEFSQGKNSKRKIPKVKSWGNFSKQSSPAPEQKEKCRTASPPARSWSSIASNKSQQNEHRNITTGNENDQEESKSDVSPKESIKTEKEKKNTQAKTESDDDVENIYEPEEDIPRILDIIQKDDTLNEIYIKNDELKIMTEIETKINDTNDLKQLQENVQSDNNRYKRKKGKSKAKKVETPPGNSSDSDVVVINEEEIKVKDEIQSIKTELEKTYNMKDIVVAQCCDPYEDEPDRQVYDDIFEQIENTTTENIETFQDDEDDCEMFDISNVQATLKEVTIEIDEINADFENTQMNKDEFIVDDVSANLLPVTYSQVACLMEKSSDDDNTSPIISSQTDSDDREERKPCEVIITVPPPKPMANKKKSKKKRR